MRAHRKRIVVIAAVGVLAAAGLALEGSAVAASSPPSALTGTVAQTTAVDVADLVVYVKPEKAIEAATPLGEIVHYHRLPDTALNMVGDHYTVSAHPEDLPDSTISDEGVVTFQVVAVDAEATPLGFTSASVRAVYDTLGTPQWMDPLASTDGVIPFPGGTPRADAYSAATSDTMLGPVTADLVALPGASVPATAINDDEIEPPGSDELTDPDDTTQQEVNASAAVAVSCQPMQGAGNVKVAEKSVWTTIGTGYPVNGDTSTMSYVATSGVDYTTTVGVASDSVGTWQQSSTETVSRGVGFDWTNKTYARSYRVGIEYAKVAHYYDRCPPSQPYYRSWDPVKLSGNAGENSGIQRPDFRTCRKFTATVNWWRYDSVGQAYSLSYGVKMFSTIGVDLSSRRAYSNEAKLGYLVTSGRWLCGNGGDVPGDAGKVMERLNDA